jgi:beta-galactosidase
MRLPKFSFYFYQSQVDAAGTDQFNKPMLHIANYWQAGSDTLVKIYSNCDEVELFLNGRSLGKQSPDKDKYSTNLSHPPFTFQVPFKPGTLKAVGYIKGIKAAEHQRSTPGTAARISLRADYSGKELKAGQNDIVFVYADVVDTKGTIIYDAGDPIEFTVTGDAVIVGENPRAAEAGTAAILIKAGSKPGNITVSARTKGVKQGNLVLTSK